MTKKRWTVEDKAKIVIESLTTTASTADICKKYGLSPNTFYPWREKFLEGGRAALARSPERAGHKGASKGECHAQDAGGRDHPGQRRVKKNVGGKEKVMAAQSLIRQEISLNKALRWCGVTRKRWYYVPRARESAVDPDMLQMIQDIREERPFYGTRRTAAELSRRLNRTVNRKLVRRIYKRMGWGLPEKASKGAKTRWKPIRATRPNQVWETDHTLHLVRPPSTGSAIASTSWTYSPDSGWPIGSTLWPPPTSPSSRWSRQSPWPNRTAPGSPCSVTTDPQYAGKKFRKAASLLGIGLKFIRIHTPEQNGHIESFHNTLKREYIWPHDFSNYQQAEAVISEAFRDYNRNRLHSALKYVPSAEFLASWEAAHK